ncbi:hypothetical protein ABIB99_008929, partial [Bradyrhizobium sp. LA6.1]|uniref:hypothetical protein n=1 Tax=Bradyrhizobium sp. LA6.1 TaxID=3156378 RepID=UPI003392FB56
MGSREVFTGEITGIANGATRGYFREHCTSEQPMVAIDHLAALFGDSMELSPNFGDGRSRSGGGGYGLTVGRLGDDLDP